MHFSFLWLKKWGSCALGSYGPEYGQTYGQEYYQEFGQAYDQTYGQANFQASSQVHQAKQPISIKSNKPQAQSDLKDLEFHSRSKISENLWEVTKFTIILNKSEWSYVT